MRAYADTSFLVKLLSEEPGAAEAVAEYRRLRRPRLFYLPLHALELENAIRHRAFHERRNRPAGERAQIKRERDAALARVGQYLKRVHSRKSRWRWILPLTAHVNFRRLILTNWVLGRLISFMSLVRCCSKARFS